MITPRVAFHQLVLLFLHSVVVLMFVLFVTAVRCCLGSANIIAGVVRGLW